MTAGPFSLLATWLNTKAFFEPTLHSRFAMSPSTCLSIMSLSFVIGQGFPQVMENGSYRYSDTATQRRERPVSEFLPYLPYSPRLKQSLTEIHARNLRRPYVAYRPHPERNSPATAEKRRAITPETKCLSWSATCSITAHSVSTYNSYITNPLLTQPLLATSVSQNPKALPLPPSLIAKPYGPTTMICPFDPAAPLGSEANPAELSGTPPWEWLPELPV